MLAQAASPASTSFLGRRVSKWFGSLGVFSGRVTREYPSDDLWHVVYDDGDEEDLTREELEEVLEPLVRRCAAWKHERGHCPPFNLVNDMYLSGTTACPTVLPNTALSGHLISLL